MLTLVFAGCLLALPAIDAQTTSPPPAPEAAPPVTADRLSTALALLDRIDRLATAARKDLESDDLEPVGTTGRAGASGTVTIRAADLDEIRAEIAQIKLLLKASGT